MSSSARSTIAWLSVHTVQSSAGPLRIDPVMRELPGRRIAGETQWRGQRAFAKAFLGSEASRYGQREVDGLTALVAAGAHAPRVLRRERISDGELLVMDWCDGDVPRPSAPETAASIAATLAELHERGVVLTDPHLGNFLVGHRRVTCVDGDGVRRRRRLGRDEALNNLGRFLAEYHVGHHAVLASAVAAYSGARGWLERPHTGRLLSPARAARCELIRRKALRSSSLGQRDSRDGWMRIVAAGEEALAESLAGDLSQRLSSGEVLKAGGSAHVTALDIDGASVVLKHFRQKSVARLLRRAVSGSRAARSWQAGQALPLFGIPTPRPILYTERRVGPFALEAYVAWHRFPGEPLSDQATPVQARSAAELLRDLHAIGLAHTDTKATNFLADGDRVCVIDLDGVCPLTPGLRQRDCDRLLANWPSHGPAYSAAAEVLARPVEGQP